MPQFQINETIFFVCAEQQKCSQCTQSTSDLDYSVQAGLVVGFQELIEAIYPTKEIPCGCAEGTKCLCARKSEIDWDGAPTSRTHVSYNLKAEMKGLGLIPEQALYQTEVQAQIALDSQSGMPVLVKPDRVGLSFPELSNLPDPLGPKANIALGEENPSA